MLFERVWSTSWNSLVASIRRVLSESITLVEWLALCFARSALAAAIALCSEASCPLIVWMSCLMIIVSSLISIVGSSKRDCDCASCVSLDSLSAIKAVPAPICDAAAANSERLEGGRDDEIWCCTC